MDNEQDESKNDYYEDFNGNKIIGKRGNTKIVFQGQNSCVYFFEDEITELEEEQTVRYTIGYFQVGSNSTISIGKKCIYKACMTVGNNTEITFGEECILDGNFKFGDMVRLHVGNKFRMSSGLFAMRHNAICNIGNNCFFDYGNQITIAENANCSIGDDFTKCEHGNMVVCPYTELTIGDDCMFSYYVSLWTNDGHSIFDIDTQENINSTLEKCRQRKVRIGNHVWLGYGVIVLYGSEIGDGSIVGAYSFIKQKIPNNCIFAGNPAKMVRKNIAWCRQQNGAEDISACEEKYIHYTICE